MHWKTGLWFHSVLLNPLHEVFNQWNISAETSVSAKKTVFRGVNVLFVSSSPLFFLSWCWNFLHLLVCFFEKTYKKAVKGHMKFPAFFFFFFWLNERPRVISTTECKICTEGSLLCWDQQLPAVASYSSVEQKFKVCVYRKKVRVGWMMGILPHKGCGSTDSLTLMFLFSFAFPNRRFWGRLCFCELVGNSL